MSWWTRVKSFFKKASRFILPIVAIVLPELIPTIGAQILGTSEAIAAGTATTAQIAAANAAGAATISGSSAALAGESPSNIAKAAAIGGVTAGAGSLAGSQFGEAASQTDPLSQSARVQYPGQAPNLTYGQQISQGVQGLGGSAELGTAASVGAGSALTGTAKGLASGQDLGQALKTGATSGLVSGTTDYLSQQLFPTMPQSTSEKLARGAVETGVSYGLSSLFQPSSSYSVGTPAPTGSSTTTTASPGSSALAQALGVADPGTAYLGTKGGERKPVWNVESLKLTDELGGRYG
jgi:hypothetical protein